MVNNFFQIVLTSLTGFGLILLLSKVEQNGRVMLTMSQRLKEHVDHVFWSHDVYIASKERFENHGINSEMFADRIRALIPSATIVSHYQHGNRIFVEFKM